MKRLTSICTLLIVASLPSHLSAEANQPQNTSPAQATTPAPPSPFQHPQMNNAPAVTMPQVGLPNSSFNYGQYGNYKGLPNYLKDHPAILLKNAVERVSQFVSKGGAQDVQTLDRFLDEQISPFFDFERMASLVGGRFYQTMDEPNRKEFQQRLQLLMFDTLTSYIVSFDGSMPRTAFYPPIMNGNNQMIARLRVLRQSMPPTNLAFRFTKGDNGWKVVDVAANGQSAILYYRQYYRSYIQEIMMRERMQQRMQSQQKPADTISPNIPAIPEPQMPSPSEPKAETSKSDKVGVDSTDDQKPESEAVDKTAKPVTPIEEKTEVAPQSQSSSAVEAKEEATTEEQKTEKPMTKEEVVTDVQKTESAVSEEAANSVAPVQEKSEPAAEPLSSDATVTDKEETSEQKPTEPVPQEEAKHAETTKEKPVSSTDSKPSFL